MIRCKKCDCILVDSKTKTSDGRVIYVCPIHANIQAVEASHELKALLSIMRQVIDAQIVINYEDD